MIIFFTYINVNGQLRVLFAQLVYIVCLGFDPYLSQTFFSKVFHIFLLSRLIDLFLWLAIILQDNRATQYWKLVMLDSVSVLQDNRRGVQWNPKCFKRFMGPNANCSSVGTFVSTSRLEVLIMLITIVNPSTRPFNIISNIISNIRNIQHFLRTSITMGTIMDINCSNNSSSSSKFSPLKWNQLMRSPFQSQWCHKLITS